MTTPVSNNNGNNNFDEILDRCLQAVESGQMTIEQCAARYPNYPELASLLRMATAFTELPRPQMPGVAPLQRRLQTQFREQYRTAAPRGVPSFPWRRLLVTIGVMLLVIFIGGAGLVSASASALPGDGLTYSVKRGYESLRLSFARENDRPQMLYDLAETRLHEVRDLAAQGRTVNEATVDDVYNSVTLALGSVTDTGKRNQLTTDAVNAVQAALTQGVINPALAQLTTQKLQIVSNVSAPNGPTPTPSLVEATTATPLAVPSTVSSGTPEATQLPSITFTPSFTASPIDTKAPPTSTPNASPTQTLTFTPTATVMALVVGPSATPTLGRGPAVTVPGLPTTPAPATQTPTAQATTATPDTPTSIGTDVSTEPATQEATATTEITDTPADTATNTPSFTPTITKTSTPTITPKPPTATPTATATNSATPVPTPNGLPAQSLKQNPQEITFHDCKPEGSGGDPAENLNRNRVDDASQYPTTVFDNIAKFPWPKEAEGKPHSQWSQDTQNAIAQAEGLPVMVEVYLVKVQEDGPEVQNCNSTYHTWQLWLLGTPGSDLTKALVAGVTPRIAANHTGWTLDKLNALAAAGAKVRISGWLMFDEDQAGEVGKSRASLWEIHPVMQIAVAKGNQWVNLDDYQP